MCDMKMQKVHELAKLSLVYTVSQKKTSKIIFVITTSNFHQMW